ncbi:MAG: SpoIID/LytB domain-containing protein, partial [Anaerovoracaceae bacterium]
MREMLRCMIQLMIVGLIFLAVVPLAAVLLFGQLGQAEGPDLQLPFRNRVKTPDTITVWLEDQNRAVKVDFEAYVCRVVASEMPSTFE